MVGLAERFRAGTSVKDWTPRGQDAPAPYVRPADWLALPVVNVGDQKFVGLHAVWNHESNFVAVNCAGAYTVDWGDGTAAENIATGVQANHNYAWSALGAGTVTSRGYRQAIVTITPQAGQNLTTVNLLVKHNQSGLVGAGTTGWLDIRMAGSLITTLTVGSISTTNCAHRMLEQFDFIGTNGVTSFSDKFRNCPQFQSLVSLYTGLGTTFANMFNNGCTSLRTIPLLNTAAGSDFSSMFSGCTSLQTIPLLNTATGTNFTSMFNGCSSLQTIPLLNTAAGSDFSSMFSGCRSLQTIPLLNTAAGTTFFGMFTSCTSLQTIPLLNTAAGSNFATMFTSCTSLQTIPLLNTAAGTTFASMFSGCTSLQTIPLLNTAAGTTFASMFSSCTSLQTIPLLNTAAGTTFSNMFSGCSSLQTIPLLNTAAGTNFTSMFQNCTSLQTIPLLNTGAGANFTSMFNTCSALEVVPALNVAAGMQFSLMFSSCPSLRSAPLVGTVADISYASCSLGPAALDAIYTALASTANMLSANAASVDATGATDWTTVVNSSAATFAPGGSITGIDGTVVLRLTSTAAGASSVASTTRWPVSPSTQYTFLASSAGLLTGRSWTVAAAWYDAGGALISADTSGSLTSAVGSMGQNSVTATSPVNAVTVSLIMSFTASAGGQQVVFDKMGLFPGTVSTWTPGKATVTVTGNWGTTSDTPSIATAKGWTVTGS